MSTLESKTIIDIARGFAAVLLAIAAIFLGAATFVHGRANGPLLQITFLSLSTFHIFLAARTIDWMLDRIDYELWMNIPPIGTVYERERFKNDFHKWHGLYFRIRIFGGAYFAFVIIISVIASSAIYISISEAQKIDILPSFSQFVGSETPLKFLISCLLLVYIPYQMLTVNTIGGRYLFAGGVFLILAFVIRNLWLFFNQ